MSMFSNPWQQLPNAGDWSRMTEELNAPLSKDMVATMRLMANPAASFAAMSALGFGLASHAFGLWAGTVLGAAQASQRLFASGLDASQIDRPTEAKRPAAEVVTIQTRQKPALKVVAQPEPAPQPEPNKVAASAPVAPPEPLPTAAQPLMAKAPAAESAPTAKPAKKVSAKVANETPRKPAALARPEIPNDLKAISGIGPKLEKVLNDLGIWTYAQVAAWEKQEIAWVDDYLSFKGRIDRDGWIAQAARLAGEANARS